MLSREVSGETVPFGCAGLMPVRTDGALAHPTAAITDRPHNVYRWWAGHNRWVADDHTGLVTVSAVTRTVIEQMAPTELTALHTYLAAYEADPGLVRHLRPSSGDDATGFGGIDGSFTPYVVAVVSSTLTFVAAQVGEAVRSSAGQRIGRAVDWVFRRTVDRVAPEVQVQRAATLTPAQFEEVRAAAYRKACDFRLAESTAKNLADAVVGALMTSVE